MDQLYYAKSKMLADVGRDIYDCKTCWVYQVSEHFILLAATSNDLLNLLLVWTCLLKSSGRIPGESIKRPGV